MLLEIYRKSRVGGARRESKYGDKVVHMYISERTVDMQTKERYRDGATASRGGGSRTVGSVEFYVACLLQEFSRQASLR